MAPAAQRGKHTLYQRCSPTSTGHVQKNSSTQWRAGEAAKNDTACDARDSTKVSKIARVTHAESRNAVTYPMTDVSSFDSFARGASTTGDYYSAAGGMTTQKSDYQTAFTSAITIPQMQTSGDFIPRPVATSKQRKVNAKGNLDLDQGDTQVAMEAKDEVFNTPRTIQQQALADATLTAMSKCLEPLIVVKETKNKPTKYRRARDGKADGWMDDVDETPPGKGARPSNSARRSLTDHRVSRARSEGLHYQQIRGGKRH